MNLIELMELITAIYKKRELSKKEKDKIRQDFLTFSKNVEKKAQEIKEYLSVYINKEIKKDKATIKYTRASQHIGLQSILNKNKVPEITELTKGNQDLRIKVQENNITELGANLSVRAHYALFALQTLYTETGYKGNTTKGTLKITTSEFLNAYGLIKKPTKRGKFEYDARERESAITALYELEKQRLWYFSEVNEEMTKKKKEPRFNMVTGTDAIIRIKRGYWDLSKEEQQKIINGAKKKNKITCWEITPTDIFLAQNFILIPSHIFNLARQKYGKVPTHLINLITLICIQASYKNYKVTYFFDTLAQKFNLQNYINTRQIKRLKEILQIDFEHIKNLGLINSYIIEKDDKRVGKVTLELTRAAFHENKKLI